MRVLCFGAIAAVLSAAAWFGLEYLSRMEFPWLAVAVGLATGWGVHRGAQVGAGSGYGRGALAALLTLVAIVGGRQVYASIMLATHDYATGVARVVETEEEIIAEKPADDAAEDSEVAPVVAQNAVRERVVDVAPNLMRSPLKVGGSEWDMVWMTVGSLAAYVIGKGNRSAAAPKPVEEPVPTPPAQ